MKPHKKDKHKENLVQTVEEEVHEQIMARYESELDDDDHSGWDDDFDYSCPCCNQDWHATYDVDDWIEQSVNVAGISEEDREKYPRAQTAWEIMTSKLWKVLS